MTHFNAFLLLAGNIFGDLCDTRIKRGFASKGALKLFWREKSQEIKREIEKEN